MDTRAPSPSSAASRSSRADITEAVLRVLSTGGTDDLTVRKVAAEARVSVGAVQHHFPTRAALITGAMDAVTVHFRDRIGDALAQVDSAEERLRTFCEELAALGDAGRRDAVVWTAFAARAGTDAEIRALHAREWQRTEAAVLALLTAAYPAAGITADDAAMLLALLDGIAVARGAEGDDRMPPSRGRALIGALLASYADRA